MRYSLAVATVSAATLLVLSPPVVLAAPAAGAVLTIQAQTRVTLMAGLPSAPPPPTPSGSNKAKAGQAAGPSTQAFAARKTLAISLRAPGEAPADASATVKLPSKSGLPEKTDLMIIRDTKAFLPIRAPWMPSDDLVIQSYSGSGSAVQSGQPVSTAWNKLTEDQKAALRTLLPRANRSQPTGAGSLAVWPAGRDAMVAPAEASLAGLLEVDSNYAGKAAFEIPSKADFLPPVEIVAPDLSHESALDKALVVTWKPVTGAIGMRVDALGIKGKDELVHWSAIEKPEPRTYRDDLSASDIESLVASGALLAPGVTSVTIPAGILKDCDMALLNICALGAGAVSPTDPVVRVCNVSSVTAVLSRRRSAVASPRPDSPAQ